MQASITSISRAIHHLRWKRSEKDVMVISQDKPTACIGKIEHSARGGCGLSQGRTLPRQGRARRQPGRGLDLPVYGAVHEASLGSAFAPSHT